MSLAAFLSRINVIADTRAKKLALLLLMGYITFKVYRCFLQQQHISSSAKSTHSKPCESLDDTNKNISDEKSCSTTTESKAETDVAPEQKVESEVATELEVPRRYIAAKKSKGIPVSEEMLIIESAGHCALNGGYRWFLHDEKWCLFNDKSSQHFCLQNGIPAENVYKQLNDKQFKWEPSVQTCWILSDIDGKVIYYAAAEVDNEYIPNDTTEWIVVCGTEPTPQIFVNLMDKTAEPDTEEQFGNVVPSQAMIQNVFRELDVENKGTLDRETVLEGFKKLGIELSMEQIRTFVMDKSKGNDEGFTENEFCDAIAKWSKSIKQNISFSVKENKESDDNDNGVIVHKEKDDGEDEESQISDLDA